MNGALQRVGFVLVGISAIGGIITLPASAQTIQTNPNQALPGLGNSDQSSDALSGAEGLSMYDLIHQLQLGPRQSLSEFNRQQQRTINSAASDFRTRQLERLRQQNPQTQPLPTAPTPAAQPTINTPPQ